MPCFQQRTYHKPKLSHEGIDAGSGRMGFNITANNGSTWVFNGGECYGTFTEDNKLVAPLGGGEQIKRCNSVGLVVLALRGTGLRINKVARLPDNTIKLTIGAPGL